MLWEWKGIANMDFIKLGGSSRVLSDFAEKYGSKNRVLAGFGIGGKSGKENYIKDPGIRETQENRKQYRVFPGRYVPTRLEMGIRKTIDDWLYCHNQRNALGMERDCQHGLYKAGMGSSRVLSDFAEKYGSKNRVLAGFGIGGKSGKEKRSMGAKTGWLAVGIAGRWKEKVNKLVVTERG
ncbi:hypothetical protein Tco_0003543 [Tanacetum coccineum]